MEFKNIGAPYILSVTEISDESEDKSYYVLGVKKMELLSLYKVYLRNAFRINFPRVLCRRWKKGSNSIVAECGIAYMQYQCWMVCSVSSV